MLLARPGNLRFNKAFNLYTGTKITADGQIPDICIGASVEEDISYYYDRTKELNDTHGIGAFLMAGAEMIKQKINW